MTKANDDITSLANGRNNALGGSAMSYTKDELKKELRKIGKGDLQVIHLLHPKVEPLKDHPNIRTGYLGLEEWLTYQPTPLQRNLRAAVARYEIAKADYRNQTNDALTAIGKRASGKAVLAEIAAVNALKLTIRPYRPEKDDDMNATADGLSARKSTVLGLKVRGSDGKHHPAWGEGTGEGSPVNVDFTPAMWGASGSANITGPGSLPDEVLLHELVHAGRQMKGVVHSKAVDSGYANEEEFVAIVVANIYLSEKKQTILRGTHRIIDRKIVVGQKFDVLPSPEKFLDNPQNMSPPPYQLLEKIRLRQRNLWDALGNIKPTVTVFNPARDWEAKRSKVFIDI